MATYWKALADALARAKPASLSARVDSWLLPHAENILEPRCLTRLVTVRSSLVMVEDHHAQHNPSSPDFRVLLVEDDPHVRRASKRFIERLGWHVTACADAEEALDTIEDNSFQVVVSDIHLPGRDGVELMRELRTRGVDVPFVLLSGVTDPIRPAEGIADGACCFMTKPLCLDILAAAVEKATRFSAK